MKNKSEKIFRFLYFAGLVAFAAYIILFLHRLLTESDSYKFLIGVTLIILITVFIRIFWAFRKLREVGKRKNCP